jgi:hypothetical protein
MDRLGTILRGALFDHYCGFWNSSISLRILEKIIEQVILTELVDGSNDQSSSKNSKNSLPNIDLCERAKLGLTV